jgi:dTDP-4-amino-4,6-dideoxygalactose transaminase
VEDAACAIGSEISFDGGTMWEKIGRPHGDIACFSFHPRKVLTTGDGGMITTNDAEVDAKCRLLRQHGMSVPDMVKHKSQKVIFENYVTTGFNYRMTDIQAAVGIEQLKRLNAILLERIEIADKYRKLFKDLPHIKTPHEEPFLRSNWQSYPIKLSEEISLSQKDIMQLLLDRGISTRRGIMNAHQEPVYQTAQWSLPRSEECRDCTILLPLYNGIGEKNLRYIADTLHDIFTHRN